MKFSPSHCKSLLSFQFAEIQTRINFVFWQILHSATSKNHAAIENNQTKVRGNRYNRKCVSRFT